MGPEKLEQTNYVPKVPDSGTNLAHNILRHKIHTFVVYLIFLKNLTTPSFLVGLIYRWGKGPKTKNICINVTFSYTICEKNKNNFFFFLLFFTFLTFWGENMTFWG